MLFEFAISIPMDGRRKSKPRRGGKLPAALLSKPVTTRKRAAFLRWMLADAAGRAMPDAMAEFGMSRQNVITQFGVLYREHGIGYEVANSMIRPLLPEGCTAETVFGGTSDGA